MFYTLQDMTYHHYFMDGRNQDRFICFEAHSRTEAAERAEWFGIDLEETFTSHLTIQEYKRWDWMFRNAGNESPMIGQQRIDSYANSSNWVLVYLDGNIRSSRTDLEQNAMETMDELIHLHLSSP
jgi:hypothetical protein